MALFAAKNNLPGENSSRLKPALGFTEGRLLQTTNIFALSATLRPLRLLNC